MKSNWNELTVNEFIQLEQLLKADIPESYRTAHVIALLDNKSLDEVENLPISTFISMAENLSFIQTQPKYNDIQKEYIINNHIYELKSEIPSITTAQYIDYQNYSKEGDLTKLLSVWVIPKGHKYNDGYDMIEVIQDMGHMLLQDAMGICFFFPKQLAASVLIIQQSLKQNLKELKMKKIPDKKIKEMETLLSNLASQYWFLPYAKERTQALKT